MQALEYVDFFVAGALFDQHIKRLDRTRLERAKAKQLELAPYLIEQALLDQTLLGQPLGETCQGSNLGHSGRKTGTKRWRSTSVPPNGSFCAGYRFGPRCSSTSPQMNVRKRALHADVKSNLEHCVGAAADGPCSEERLGLHKATGTTSGEAEAAADRQRVSQSEVQQDLQRFVAQFWERVTQATQAIYESSRSCRSRPCA